MKKLLLSLIFLNSFQTTVLSQITVPISQKSLYGIVEATWCGVCGQYGIPTTRNVKNQVGGKVVTMTWHASSNSSLYSSIAEQLSNAMNVSGQPFWTLNGIGVGNYNSSIQSSIIQSINTNYNAMATDVNAGLIWKIQNDSLLVETQVNFFNTVNGSYKLALYVVEDSVWAYQSNYDPNIPSSNIYHRDILRTEINNQAFGVSVASGTITSGTKFSGSYKLKTANNWNSSRLKVVAVIWKESGNGHVFVNTNDERSTVIITDIMKQNKSFDYNLFPNPSSDIIYLSGINQQYDVSIFNSNGQNVYSERNKSDDQIIVDDFPSGIYSVIITIENEMKVKRFVKR